jgi:hypothetical protein
MALASARAIFDVSFSPISSLCVGLVCVSCAGVVSSRLGASNNLASRDGSLMRLHRAPFGLCGVASVLASLWARLAWVGVGVEGCGGDSIAAAIAFVNSCVFERVWPNMLVFDVASWPFVVAEVVPGVGDAEAVVVEVSVSADALALVDPSFFRGGFAEQDLS